MVPASKVLVQSMVVEGDALFTAHFQHQRKRYPEAYTPSTLVPGPEYSVALTGWVPNAQGA